ncbi:MAG: helix-turn-helix transcriptional regulator [Actinomycetota bacterium]
MTGAVLVRTARRRAGLSQKQLAERLGTTQSAVARWEAGRVSPTLETLDRIVRACGLGLELRLAHRDDHDLGLGISNLRLTPEQRLDQMLAAQHFARELRDAAAPSS